MRLQNQATGTAHARLPSGGHGPSRCHLRTLIIAPQAAFAAVWRWPNPMSSRPGHVGQSVCGAKTKIITGRYRPVPGTGTGAGHSDPVDPVTRWNNLVRGNASKFLGIQMGSLKRKTPPEDFGPPGFNIELLADGNLANY
jgi:hypothetical protein